jgi:restriction system protein
MARRQTTMGSLAQQQRAHAQHVAAQERYRRQQEREWERARRAQERAARADERERQRLYLAEQQAEAEHRTAEVAATCNALRSVLADTLEVDDWFDLDLLKGPLDLPEFDPGVLGQPVPMPDPQQYTLPPLSAVQSLRSSAQQRHAEQQAALTYQWHHDTATAQSHEAERVARLGSFRLEWETWFALRCLQIREQHAAINLMKHRLEEGDPQTVAEYTAAVLQQSTWPEGFPGSFDLSFEPSERHMVVDYAGPDFGVVPEERSFRYVKASDEIRPVAMPAAERKTVYREAIAQLVLRVAHEIFESDRPGHVRKVTVNCFVDSLDPATGRQVERCVGNLSCDRQAFEPIDLAAVEPTACLRGLKGQLLDRPDTGRVPVGVRAAQAGGAAHNSSGAGSDDEPNLLEMDPIEFEQLVGRLLTAMGWNVKSTQRSGDGGVDLVADDPDPAPVGPSSSR